MFAQMFAQMFAPCLPHLETLAFIAATKFASWKTKIFPTKLETFDETIFLRLPTLVRQYKMPFPALQKEIYRVLKVTKCRKISQIVLSTRVTEIISIDFVVYY